MIHKFFSLTINRVLRTAEDLVLLVGFLLLDTNAMIQSIESLVHLSTKFGETDMDDLEDFINLRIKLGIKLGVQRRIQLRFKRTNALIEIFLGERFRHRTNPFINMHTISHAPTRHRTSFMSSP